MPKSNFCVALASESRCHNVHNILSNGTTVCPITFSKSWGIADIETGRVRWFQRGLSSKSRTRVGSRPSPQVRKIYGRRATGPRTEVTRAAKRRRALLRDRRAPALASAERLGHRCGLVAALGAGGLCKCPLRALCVS